MVFGPIGLWVEDLETSRWGFWTLLASLISGEFFGRRSFEKSTGPRLIGRCARVGWHGAKTCGRDEVWRMEQNKSEFCAPHCGRGGALGLTGSRSRPLVPCPLTDATALQAFDCPTLNFKKRKKKS